MHFHQVRFWCHRARTLVKDIEVMATNSIHDAAVVRNLPDAEDLNLKINHQGKVFQLNRAKSGSLKNTLQRIALKLEPKKKKKKGVEGEKDINESVPAVTLFNEGIEVSGDTNNEESLHAGAVLHINATNYCIKVNPPTVAEIVLSDINMSDFPTFPSVKFEFSDQKYAKFEWFRSNSKSSKADNIWELVSHSFVYTPTVDDISYYLKCKVTPATSLSTGPYSAEATSIEPVSAGPGICLFDERQLYTQNHLLSDDEFRIVCYNILADVFATTEYAKEVLYPYVPEYVIKSQYRRQLLGKEILGYHADLICLQECQQNFYENYLKPLMIVNRYEGFLMQKIGEMPEGEALFYRTDKFKHVKDYSISVREAMTMDCNKELRERLKCAPSVLESVSKKSAIAQIHLLQDLRYKNKYLYVLNTHLYYKRFAVRTRLLQLATLMNYLNNVMIKEDAGLIVCGDLNSLKSSLTLDFLSGIEIKNSAPVWHTGEDGDVESNKLNLDLKLPLKLANLSGNPEFTVYVPHCKTTLDYVYGNETLEVNGFVPLPEANAIEPYIGLPCIVSPSDHLALVMDMKWK